MPANDARRLELLKDAGFPHPEATLAGLRSELQGVTRDAFEQRIAQVPPDQLRLAKLVPELLGERSGDLATALWLARSQHGDALQLGGWLVAVLDAYLSAAREKEALAIARFLLEGGFDWQKVYGSSDTGHAFLQARDPNPLIWQLLEELAPYRPLRVLELGCGVGNDAMGLLESPDVERYLGIDVVPEAIEGFRKRIAGRPFRSEPELICGDFSDVLTRPEVRDARYNCIYAYSSLHYFASTELRRIFGLVRNLLLAGGRTGFFAFGLKGTGSVWEGQGVPLYRPDVWVNWDGQSRWFPTRGALARELDAAGFEIRVHESHNHWGYSEKGKRDTFHYVVCTPRASFLGEGI